MTATKTEEPWVKDFDGMTSTVVVLVTEDDTVQVSEYLIEDFGLDPERGKDIVLPGLESFAREFPVSYIRERLEAEGWSRANPDA